MKQDMFSPFRRMIEVFQEKGATTREKALTWKELGFPAEFEEFSPSIPLDESPIVRVGNKYYLSEKRLTEFRKRRNELFSPLRKWIKHTAKVPKGFLRYQVLYKLKERPMSGSELTAVIEEDLGGFWRPKPGSMYPLLKSLLRDGLTAEIPDEDGRTRRYELTEKGREFIETEIDKSGELREKVNQILFPSTSFSPFMSSPEKLPPALQNLFPTLLSLRILLMSTPSQAVLEEIAQAAERFIVEIEEIRKKIELSESSD